MVEREYLSTLSVRWWGHSSIFYFFFVNFYQFCQRPKKKANLFCCKIKLLHECTWYAKKEIPFAMTKILAHIFFSVKNSVSQRGTKKYMSIEYLLIKLKKKSSNPKRSLLIFCIIFFHSFIKYIVQLAFFLYFIINIWDAMMANCCCFISIFAKTLILLIKNYIFIFRCLIKLFMNHSISYRAKKKKIMHALFIKIFHINIFDNEM